MLNENNERLSELIEELTKGNALALTEIAQLMEKVLICIGNLYYKNRADVEDAIQNLYVKLYMKASYYKKNTNASAWIIKIFENSIKSHLRHLQKEDKYLREEISYFKSNASAIDEQYVENYLFLQEILDKLTEEDRKIIIYYHWCGCTIREIAHILHKPSSTIHKKLVKLEEKIKNI